MTKEEALIMVADINEKEIKEAMFDIGENRAPGPDGYTSAFFKHSWDIVGNDICQAIKEFFMTGKLLGEINATLITLIPKIPHPNKVSEYRPIACCNVLYKCISKIITNRIKKGLDKLVNVNQSAFVPGRNGPSRCSLKNDIAKAYDTVDWDFLRNVLVNFGFHGKMVNWIMTCVSSAAFTIGINVFSLMLARKVHENKKFKFHKGCKEMELTRLSFADDLLVLCHGDEVSVNVIKEALLEFSNCSGLKPNMEKSVVFFGSVKEVIKQKILAILPFKVGKLPVKNLGIPLLAKKLGINDCKQLVDKVKCKIQDWKNRFLSYAGKLQLIAAVLSTMQTYWASVLQIPKTVVNEIDGILKKFLWEGGLGIKHLGDWNEVLLSKQIWKIIAKKEGLWVKWVNLVKLKGKSFWVIEEEAGDSGTWKALLELRNKIRPYTFHQIGNGEDVSMWNDNCCDLGHLKQFVTNKDIHEARIHEDCSVAEMSDDNKWNWPEQWVKKFSQLRHLQVPSLNKEKYDHAKWRKRNGQLVDFSVRGVWWELKCVYPNVSWYKVVWFSQCNPRCAFILWMAIKGKLATQDNIMKWNNSLLLCPLCSKCNDSHNHLFFKCDFSTQIWQEMSHKMNMGLSPNNWSEIVNKVAELPCTNAIRSILRRLILATSVYYIWKERNSRLFTNNKMNAQSLLQAIEENISLQLHSLRVKDSKQVKSVAAEWNAGEYFRAAQSSAIVQQRESDLAPEESLETPFLTDQDLKTDQGKQDKLGFLAGLVPKSKAIAFERILFRATRGNVFLWQAPMEEAVIDPSSGEKQKAKFSKYVKLLGANRYPFADDPSKQEQTITE
ncbi:RNA-directed DNA polymerase, eukaryota, reverse transcriptase zinc-binding domain protein, partial [Tanacetum coccineum]